MASPSSSSSLHCGKFDILRGISSSSNTNFIPILVTSSICCCQSRLRPSKALILSRPSNNLNLKFLDLPKGRAIFHISSGRLGILHHPRRMFTQTRVSKAQPDKIEDGEPIEEANKGSNSSVKATASQLTKRVVFGLGIGLSAGGVVLTGGWVFSMALAAAVFAGAREYFELVRSRGIASGMTPPPRYVSRVCSVICALMPLFTLYKGQIDVSVTSAAFVVAITKWKSSFFSAQQ